METTIKRTLTGKEMEAIFDAQHDRILIKHYEALNIPNDETYNPKNKYKFAITIRHPEEENATLLFVEARRKLKKKQAPKIVTPTLEKRYKILCLLCLQLDVWDKQMDELADQLDSNNPEALTALSFYEDEIIKFLEAKK